MKDQKYSVSLASQEATTVNSAPFPTHKSYYTLATGGYYSKFNSIPQAQEATIPQAQEATTVNS